MRRYSVFLSSFLAALATLAWTQKGMLAQIGVEVAIPVHLQDGQEFQMPNEDLIEFGRKLFTAMWTTQEGGGRPLTKGTGAHLSDPTDPLVFPRNFNRISAPDTNSCSGCHNKPLVGGGGDIVGNVFVLGQRFDFATFDGNETILTKGALDERGDRVIMQNISNSRKTVAMHGSGFIEMLARQMTADLQAIAAATPPGMSAALLTKGVSFGKIIHNPDATCATSKARWAARKTKALGH